jgi:hypothetical protein
MQIKLIVLGILLITCTSGNTYAETKKQYIEELEALADQKQLWLERQWINLLHYKSSNRKLIGGNNHTRSSYVDDPDFFLSGDDASNVEAELKANLAGFFTTAVSDDKHPQCRFPARYNWLVKQLDIDLDKLPNPDCALYRQWRNMVNANSVVLVFPAHHLNSPSSMFGHTLLRLDPPTAENKTDWLSYGVNFGANVPADDNSLLYAFRGLTGGYPGQFIVAPYFQKIQEYNRIENRDIWEYPLNLTPEETSLLVTHLWELKEINFDYFFFTENCSYRLLELLEIARPSAELTDDFVISAIPIDTIRSVQNGGFIQTTHYRPALASQLKHQLNKLPDALHPLVADLAENPANTDQASFRNLPSDQQYQIVQAAYRALRYREAKASRNRIAAKNSLALLKKLSQYPVQAPLEFTAPTSPENSHQSKRLSLKQGRDNDQNYSELEFRMAYHSLLDNSHGFLSGAQINMGNTAIRYYDDDNIKLQRLDVADIFSLTPKNAFFDQLSWRAYGGFERVQVADNRPLASHVTGAGGYAFELDGGTLFTLLTARIEHNRDFDDPVELALGTQLGWLYQNRLGVGSLSTSGLEFTGNEQRLDLTVEQDIVLSVNHALRFKADRRWYNKHTANEFSLSYHFFFR